MMHPTSSSDKPLIPLLNLDKVPPPKETEEEVFVKDDALLEDLIQVDTGKLASPNPGQQAANEVAYDMSSYDSSCRYPEDDEEDAEEN